MRPRVLVTRPEPGASRTARVLEAAGFEPVIVPLTRVRALDVAADRDVSGCDAAAATSANALRHAPDRLLEALRPLTVFAVGEATAQAARAAGVADARDGGGDAAALARTILGAEMSPTRLLYPCGRVRRPDFERTLAERGIDVVAVETYAVEPIAPDETAAPSVRPDAILVHSEQGARALVARLAQPDWAAAMAGVPCVAISARAAAALEGLKVAVAARPEDAAMIDALRRSL